MANTLSNEKLIYKQRARHGFKTKLPGPTLNSIQTLIVDQNNVIHFKVYRPLPHTGQPAIVNEVHTG